MLGKISQMILKAKGQGEQRYGNKKQGRVSGHPRKMGESEITSVVGKMKLKR